MDNFRAVMFSETWDNPGFMRCMHDGPPSAGYCARSGPDRAICCLTGLFASCTINRPNCHALTAGGTVTWGESIIRRAYLSLPEPVS